MHSTEERIYLRAMLRGGLIRAALWGQLAFAAVAVAVIAFSSHRHTPAPSVIDGCLPSGICDAPDSERQFIWADADITTGLKAGRHLPCAAHRPPWASGIARG